MPAITARLGAFEARVIRLPYAVTALLITLLAIIKQGLTYVQMFEDRFFIETPEALRFPDVIFARSLLVTRLLGIEDRRSYQVLSVVAALAVLALTAWLLSRRLSKGPALMAFAGIALGQIGLMILGQFGREETWLMLGAALLMLSGKQTWPAWLLGSILMSLANPGQAFIAAFLVLLLATTPHFRVFLKRTLWAVSITGTWLVVVYVQQTENQINAVGTYWLTGVNGFLLSGPLRLYSIYGALWLGIVALVLSAHKRSLIIYLVALIVFPFIFILLTSDGTRVGVGVSVLMVFALLLVGAPLLAAWFEQRIGPYPLVSVVLALLVLPTINIYEFNVVLPWDWLKYQVGDWVISALTE